MQAVVFELPERILYYYVTNTIVVLFFTVVCVYTPTCMCVFRSVPLTSAWKTFVSVSYSDFLTYSVLFSLLLLGFSHSVWENTKVKLEKKKDLRKKRGRNIYACREREKERREKYKKKVKMKGKSKRKKDGGLVLVGVSFSSAKCQLVTALFVIDS